MKYVMGAPGTAKNLRIPEFMAVVKGGWRERRKQDGDDGDEGVRSPPWN